MAEYIGSCGSQKHGHVFRFAAFLCALWLLMQLQLQLPRVPPRSTQYGTSSARPSPLPGTAGLLRRQGDVILNHVFLILIFISPPREID